MFSLCYHCCYWPQPLVFLCSFQCNSRILVLIPLHNFQCWAVLFFLLFFTYSLSMSSNGYKALLIVINFLVLWSIFLSSFRIFFRIGPEYFIKRTAQVFIPSMRFLLLGLVSRGFLVYLKLFFVFFSFISAWSG